jgi:tryptophan 2-monooxygenase
MTSSNLFAFDADTSQPMTMFGPDFPFRFDDWISHPKGLGAVPDHQLGKEVAIIGAGMAGMTAAFELMKMGLRPVIYEASRIGGRLRSQQFEGAEGIVAELGGMRFPVSSTAFYHYVNMLGIPSKPFPNPLEYPASNSTVIDLEGQSVYVEKPDQLPPFFREIQDCWRKALEEGAGFTDLRRAIRARDVVRVKDIWNQLVPIWDERTFYDFVASSYAFGQKSFRHREVFGQVGFGTGGWDSDYPNSMLEILRVVATDCDENQRYMVGGVEQVPRGLWHTSPTHMAHWPKGTTLAKLHDGATRPAARHIDRAGDEIAVTDRWGHRRTFAACLVTVQSWVLTTNMEVEERLFSPRMWMALDRTRYMQSSKTFVMTDRAFWKDKDPETGRDLMSMTLTDRLTRGTYLFDNGEGKPGVICLSYSWMSDALKMLPESPEDRVKLCLEALAKIYPRLDLKSHIIGDPITVSWEQDPNFLGAFKGALPGHYRYNHRMYCHFMQGKLPPHERGIFMAGDGVSWTPGWVEGAVQTALNAVWGIMHHLGGASPRDNPGPGDLFVELKPVELGE